MMRSSISVLIFLMAFLGSYGQDIASSGDKYFYGYAYGEAIKAYQKQLQEGKMMTNYQFLNLADAYFKTGDYKNAAKFYLDIHKNDTIMSDNRFNNMLQSLAKTSELERVKAFLQSKSASLSQELLENTNFNYELLDSNRADEAGFTVINMNGNSPQSDFSPAFYKDRLLFSSSRTEKSKKIYAPSGEPYFDIYIASVSGDGRLLSPTPFDRIPYSEYHKANPYYCESSNRLFYVLSNTVGDELAFDDHGKNALSLGIVNEDGKFSFILKDLGTSFYYPFFEESTDRLYFAANFPDGYGGTDLYYVNTANSQIMSEPINLGPRINTPGNEIAPYIFEGSLYFSSDIFYGLGGMDIYKSNFQSNGGFSIPVNLGKGINSMADDFGFIIKKGMDGGYSGYFSSNRSGGKGGDDIYAFKAEGRPGLKTLLLRGKVAKPNGTPIAGASVSLFDTDKALIEEVFTNESGAYQVEIPWRDAVSLDIFKSGYSVFSKSYDRQALEALQNNALNVDMIAITDAVEERENMQVLRLGKLSYEKGKSDISPSTAIELDKVVEVVKKFPKIRLRIISHTDSRGNDAANKQLSQRRADAIKSYLLNKGVASENLEGSIGMGEEQIMNSCTNGVYCLDFLHDQNVRTLLEVRNYNDLVQ
jgi:outer membrane protein OmpA-like peptidoglycan-associated protein